MLSETTPFVEVGSTLQVPPSRGFFKVPALVGVTGIVIVTVSPTGILNLLVPLPEEQVRVLLETEQFIVPVTPEPLTLEGAP